MIVILKKITEFAEPYRNTLSDEIVLFYYLYTTTSAPQNISQKKCASC